MKVALRRQMPVIVLRNEISRRRSTTEVVHGKLLTSLNMDWLWIGIS